MKQRFAFIIGAVFVALSSLPAFVLATEKQLPSKELVQALVDEVSGEIAFNDTLRISQFDRIQASEGWHQAAEWIKAKLEQIGYQDAVIESWPSNGSIHYYTTRTPIGWRVKRAELTLVSPRREKLASFEEMPLTLIKHSGSVHTEAELIDVGAGADEASYRGKDVRGKIVLATGVPPMVMREAMFARGAIGMIGWYTPDVRPGYPNMVRYTAFWPTWEERTKVGFGFNLSKLQGYKLKQLLDQGKAVVLRADVDTEFYETQVETLSVSFPGNEEPQKELLLVAHLCHPTPSANDNGSGSAGLLEMARALKKMVDAGAIKPPKRTIRFLWVPEFVGTVPYVKAHLERVRNTLAVINCDMIGENSAKTGGIFEITRAPDSLPTFLNDVAVHFARLVDDLGLYSTSGSENPFAFRAEPYSGGSDHAVFNDGAVRAPAVMFGHGDRFHHTSLDSIDKVDASELRRVCTIALGSIVYLASAGDPEAIDVARLVARNGLGRLSANYHDRLSGVPSASTAEALAAVDRQVREVIAHAVWRESEAIRSALNLAKTAAASTQIKAMPATVQAVASTLQAEGQRLVRERSVALGVRPAPVPAEPVWSTLVPVRSPEFVTSLDDRYLDEKLGPDTAGGLRLRWNAAYEAVNFADGKRSIADIGRGISAELEPVQLEDVHAFFEVLQKAGLVTLKSQTGVKGAKAPSEHR